MFFIHLRTSLFQASMVKAFEHQEFRFIDLNFPFSHYLMLLAEYQEVNLMLLSLNVNFSWFVCFDNLVQADYCLIPCCT